jgi:DNA repair exonuclease SbcCD ATPase subunit
MIYFQPQRGSQPPSAVRSASMVRSSSQRFQRKAEIVDTLVFMIAGLLIPAWLLGHLFLTFYPAPEPSAAIDPTETELTDVSGLSESNSDLPSVGGEESREDESEKSQEVLDVALKGKFDALTGDFQSLTQKSSDLESKVASLEKENVALENEIASLQSKSNEMNRNDADPEIISKLKSQLDASSEQLAAAQKLAADAESKLKSNEAEIETLRTDLSATQSKLESTELSLIAAKQRETQMASPANDSSDTPFAEIPSEDDDANEELLAEANMKVDQLQKQVDALNQKVNTTREMLTTREDELRSTKQIVQDLSTQNNDLKTELSTAQKTAQKTTQQTELPKEVYRDFVSSKGSVSKMAFIRWEGDEVIVRSFTNKKLYRLMLNRFSDADQQYLLEQK